MIALTINYPDDKNYWEKIYKDRLINVDSWFRVANDLIDSMNYLRCPLIQSWQSLIKEDVQQINKGIKLHGTYLMLAAYALENLYKALYIKRLIVGGIEINQKIPVEIKSHNLLAISEKTMVPLTEFGKELLIRLTEYSTWAGRYPAPIDIKYLKPQLLPDSSKTTLRFWRGADIRAIDDLIKYTTEKIGLNFENELEEKGYGKDIEEWERIIMHVDITAWGEGTISARVGCAKERSASFE